MFKRYESSEEFFAINKNEMTQITEGTSLLRSPSVMGQSGMPLQEAENLSYRFLDLMNKCTNLMFGLSASALNSKSDRNKAEALAFLESDGRVKDKEFKAATDINYLRFSKNYNDLNDIDSYLKQKHADFEKNHFYYKHLSSRD